MWATVARAVHIGRKQKPLCHFCMVAFSDGKPDSTPPSRGRAFPENALFRGPLASLSGRIAEIAEKARIRRQQHARVAGVQAVLIGLHGSIEREEVRVTSIGVGIDAVALGIALAARLLA